MSVLVSPFGPKPQFLLSTGLPAVGNQLFFYVAGSVNTKQNTYTDSGGLSANTNPLVLNSLGEPTTQIWFTSGLSYKVVYAPSTDTDPPTSPIWTIDNLSGINDVSASLDQWVAGPAPTYISATSFSVAGDQTGTFQSGRRVRTTNTGGTIYSTIVTSAFGAVTTVTVVNDSGTLDSGLSAVSYGLLSSTNPSIPVLGEVVPLGTSSGTNTITASATISAAGYRTQQAFVFIPANTNTGATTLNVNSLGAKNVFFNGAVCAGGEIKLNVPCLVVYDGTQFNIVGPTLSQDGSYTSTLTGVSGGIGAAPVRYSKIGSVVQQIWQSEYSSTSNSVTKTLTGMPAILFPAYSVRGYCTIKDNAGAYQLGSFVVNTNGVIDLYTTVGAAAWTNSGACEVLKLTLSYNINV